MPHVNHAGGCLSELLLDEWAARELSEPESARVAAHLAGCEECRARQATLAADRAEFLALAPSFAEHAARFAPHSTRRSVRLRQSLLLAASCAATLAASTLLVLWTGGALQTRSKGPPQVGWFVKRGEHVQRGSAGDALHPGDALRFVYSSDRTRYFALLNRDAHAASVFFPAGPEAVPLRAGNDVALEFSVELDEQLGEEHVYALFCDSVFTIEPLRAALLETGDLHARPGCHVQRIALRKVAPP